MSGQRSWEGRAAAEGTGALATQAGGGPLPLPYPLAPDRPIAGFAGVALVVCGTEAEAVRQACREAREMRTSRAGRQAGRRASHRQAAMAAPSQPQRSASPTHWLSASLPTRVDLCAVGRQPGGLIDNGLCFRIDFSRGGALHVPHWGGRQAGRLGTSAEAGVGAGRQAMLCSPPNQQAPHPLPRGPPPSWRAAAARQPTLAPTWVSGYPASSQMAFTGTTSRREATHHLQVPSAAAGAVRGRGSMLRVSSRGHADGQQAGTAPLSSSQASPASECPPGLQAAQLGFMEEVMHKGPVRVAG